MNSAMQHLKSRNQNSFAENHTVTDAAVSMFYSLWISSVFFNSLGYPCPVNFNPADHFVHTLAIVPGDEQNCQQRVQVRHAVVSSLNGGNSPF